MSLSVKIGITIIILLALIPVYFIFNQPEEGGKNPSTKKVKLEQKVAKTIGTEVKDETTGTTETNEMTSESQNSPVSELSEEPIKQEISKEDQESTKTPVEEEKEEVQNDFIVVIDPGHQRRANLGHEPVGPGASETKIKVTGGTAGVTTGKPEYKLTLEASLILGKLLEKRGVKVIYTRTTHDVNMSNKERAEIANQNHADLFVRIHADGSTNRNVKGLSVLTPSKDDQFTKAIYQDSLKASQLILDETKKNPAVKVNGISYRGDLSGFNWSKVPSTLIEMGFMSNPSEDENLSDTGYLTNLLTNISNGIINYSNSIK